MISPTVVTSFAYDEAVIHVEIYSPEEIIDQPGTPYGVSVKRPPLLVLHGNAGSIHEFDQQIEYFSKQRTVIAIDSRGQGKSTVNPELEITYEIMADDVLEIMNRLGVPEVHLLGFSDGAITSLLFAKNNPFRVKTLTAIGANIDPKGLTTQAREDIKEEIKRLKKERKQKELKAQGILESSEYDVELSEHEFGLEPEEVLLELLMAHPHIKLSALSEIHCPTLIITGEHDMIKPEHTKQIVSQIEHAEHKVIQGADHFVLAGYSHKVNEMVEELITANEKDLKPIELSLSENLTTEIATEADLEEVKQVYNDMIDSLETSTNYAGWKRGVYPAVEIAEKGVKDGDLFVVRQKSDGKAVASFILRYDLPFYFSAAGWENIEQEAVLMIHTLIVSPKAKSSGIGRHVLAFMEDYARKNPQTKAIRFNTSPQNVPTNYLYIRSGFIRYYAFLQPYRGLDIPDWTNPYEKRIR